MKNNFPSPTAVGSATDAFTVTPSDDDDLSQVPRALYVGGEGDVTVQFPSGTFTFVSVAAGTLLPIRPLRVLESTTATDILALV